MSKEKNTKSGNSTTNKANKKKNEKAKNIKKNSSEKKDLKKTKSKDTKLNEKKLKKELKIELEDEEEIEFDPDLEDGFGDMDEEIDEEIDTKSKRDKHDNKKEKALKKDADKIKKIEEKAKKKNKVIKSKTNNKKLEKVINFFDKYRFAIYSFVAGVLITVLIVIIIWPDRIATLKNGSESIVKVGGKNYTADMLYEEMKSKYSVSELLNVIDSDLLTKIYPEDDTMNDEVKSNAENYLNTYEQYYGYTEEQFLSANGFSSYDDFLDYLRLDYRRKKYLDDYVEDNLTDDEINDYYNDNVYGAINCQHILVEVASDSDSSSDDDSSEKLSDDDAKKLAQEIIDKINDGTSWKDIKKEYKDKVTFEDLGYQSWDSDLEDSFKEALKDMDDNSYSDEPVKTSYGYHVIYRKDHKKKPTLKKTKSKIISNLVEDKESEDENLQYKALASLRNDKKIKFYDTDMKDKYNSYLDEYK